MSSQFLLIGAAFPRTGTMSLKTALETLGIGQCYHMKDVFQNPGHIPLWEAAASGHLPEWSALLNGYAATLDFPACLFWKELSVAYPQANVLLTRRDPDSWYDSVVSTVYTVATGPEGDREPALRLVRRLFFEECMEGRFQDRGHATATYERYCDEVTKTVPNDRLLIYQVSEGWKPLCDFLGCPIPAAPFPRTNTRSQFNARNRTG